MESRKEEEFDLEDLARRLSEGIEVIDRRYRFSTYDKWFLFPHFIIWYFEW